MFARQPQTETAGLGLVEVSVESEDLQQVSRGGGPGGEHGGTTGRTAGITSVTQRDVY